MRPAISSFDVVLLKSCCAAWCWSGPRGRACRGPAQASPNEFDRSGRWLSGPSRTVVHPAFAGLGPVAPSGAVDAPDRSGHKPQAYRDPRKIAKFLPERVVGQFATKIF